MTFRRRHTDVESSSIITPLLIAELCSQRVSIRQNFPLSCKSEKGGAALGCEAGRGRGVARAGI